MYYLEIETENGSRRLELARDHLTIGRLAHCDIVLANPQISRQHAELSLREGAWWIRDLQSVNGLRFNERRITEHRLASGDRIVFAPGVSLRFLAGAALPQWPIPEALSSQRAQATKATPPSPEPRPPNRSRHRASVGPSLAFGTPTPEHHARPTVGPVLGGAGPALSGPSAYTPPGAGEPAEEDRPPYDPYRRTLPAHLARLTSQALHICQTCGQLTSPDAPTCHICHQPITTPCQTCGHILLPAQDRCPRCQSPNGEAVRHPRR